MSIALNLCDAAPHARRDSATNSAQAFFWLAAASCVVSISAGPARGDLIRLNNGGEIRGSVVRKPHGDSGTEVTIVTLTGASVVVRRDDIEFVTPRSINIELYETKLRDLPDTIEAHWELAEWCREQKLSRQRTEQLEAVLKIDADHAGAHKALRHTFHNGAWMTQEELMASRGYIRYRYRWVTQQELDLILKTDAEREAEQQWYAKVRLWLGWATAGDADRKQQGLANFASLSDSDAVPALRQFLSAHEDPAVRLMFVRCLAGLPGAKPVRPLVERSLQDPEAAIRAAAIAALPAAFHKDASELYVGALQNDLVTVVRRAAAALGEIGTQAAVDDLIDALVTQHSYKVTVQIQDPSYAVGSNGSIGFSGGTTLPPEVEGALRTGQLPYGAVVIPPRAAIRTKTLTVKRDERNREVREALKTLTNQDFGYDERTWRLWRAAQQSGAVTKATAPGG